VLSKQSTIRVEFKKAQRETTNIMPMVPEALRKWKKDCNELDILLCNQDHKTAAAVKFSLAKGETLFFAAVPWFVGMFCIKQSSENIRPGHGQARFDCCFSLERFPSFQSKDLPIVANHAFPDKWEM